MVLLSGLFFFGSRYGSLFIFSLLPKVFILEETDWGLPLIFLSNNRYLFMEKKIICITITLGTQYFFTIVNMICYNLCILKKMLVVNPSIRDILPSQQITIDHVNSKINSEK